MGAGGEGGKLVGDFLVLFIFLQHRALLGKRVELKYFFPGVDTGHLSYTVYWFQSKFISLGWYSGTQWKNSTVTIILNISRSLLFPISYYYSFYYIHITIFIWMNISQFTLKRTFGSHLVQFQLKARLLETLICCKLSSVGWGASIYKKSQVPREDVSLTDQVSSLTSLAGKVSCCWIVRWMEIICCNPWTVQLQIILDFC